MLLMRTLSQLAIGHVPPDQAQEMGHLGYMQWLGALKGDASYVHEVTRAVAAARPFMATSPAVQVFCALLVQSAAQPPRPLTLILPTKARRGGARARRKAL